MATPRSLDDMVAINMKNIDWSRFGRTLQDKSELTSPLGSNLSYSKANISDSLDIETY